MAVAGMPKIRWLPMSSAHRRTTELVANDVAT